MPIDFDLSPAQTTLKETARGFAEDVLKPIVRDADAMTDPLAAVQATIPVYEAAQAAGIAFGFLPEAYGGGGLKRRLRHRRRGDLGGRSRLRVHAARQRPRV